MIDSHCHLDTFRSECAAVLQRAHKAGVTQIVTPGVDLESSQAAVALAKQHQHDWAAVGVHPHDSRTWGETTASRLRALAANDRVVAIGEIGLDYYRDLSPRVAQRHAFQSQLELAAELGLPVIVHDRDAHDDTLAMLRTWCSVLRARHPERKAPPGVIHSFSGDVAMARRVLELGFYLGISGPVTYPNAEKIRTVVRTVPLERLLIETDAPYLAPQAKRGKRNEPAYVRYVAEAIAAARAIGVKQVIEQTVRNTCTLFRCDS